MVVLIILAAIGIGTYFYLNRPKNASSSTVPSTINVTITPIKNASMLTYDFNGTWTTYNYSHKQIPIPLLDTNGSLIIVSGPLSFEIHLDFQDKRNSCIIQPNLTYNSVSEHSAYRLGDGRVLVTLKNNLVSRDNVIAAALNIEWKLFIIDPKNCSYHDLTLMKGDYSETLVAVLPNNDTFDVVMENYKGALPKVKVTRFDNQGTEMKNFSASIKDENVPKIFMLKENDPSEGYYYIVFSNNKTRSVLKKLNDKFENVQSFEFSHGHFDEDGYSFNHERLSICSYDNDSLKNITCQIIDTGSTNKTLGTAHISNEDSIYFVTVTNLSEGGIMIVYAKRNQDKSFTVYVQHVTGEGKFDKPVEFGKVQKGLDRIYLFEMKNGSYLVAISTDDSIMTKLIVRK